MTDEIVAEVRKIRDTYAAKHGYDMARICRDLRRLEKRSGRKVIKRSGVKPKVSSSKG